MSHYKSIITKSAMVILILLSCVYSGAAKSLYYNDQELFLNGVNLAWINFARDLDNFNEREFVKVLDDLSNAGGNVLRWWLHTDGSSNPLYGEDGKVIGIEKENLKTFKRALDLAYERGILILPVLWSHDMMNYKQGVPTEANKKMIEDPQYTQAYIDNALIPLIEYVKGHPAIVGWEIFNEPEGVTEEFGWTDLRTDMKYIQQFVNLIAGAIHKTDPNSLVTVGCWNMRVLTDINGFTNYYSDERLIEAGGDENGFLDFYQVHYYPEWFSEETSPFHHPYEYWNLDKPLVVGEFPAKGIVNIGKGFAPKRELGIVEAYEYLFKNGYAGALSWMYYDTGHGSFADTKPAITHIYDIAQEKVKIEVGEIDRIPLVKKNIENLFVEKGTEEIVDYVNLNDIFYDFEGDTLSFSVTKNDNPLAVELKIDSAGFLSIKISPEFIGVTNVEIEAEDSVGNKAWTSFIIRVIDPSSGNVALGKEARSSSNENPINTAAKAVDGLFDTRWSSKYTDNEWIGVDLGDVFLINEITLHWEVAYGLKYAIQCWDGEKWITVYQEDSGDGGMDHIILEAPVESRFIRMLGIKRGTEWGYSLWEFEVFGKKVEGSDPELLITPFDWDKTEETEKEESLELKEVYLLYDFETDDEGWKIVEFWPSIKTIEVTDEMSTSNSRSLKLEGVYSGEGWQEGGIFVFPEIKDWSGWDMVMMDLYVPEKAKDFIAQIYFKIGDSWTWVNTADIYLIPESWNTIRVNLNDLIKDKEVKEFGIKIGSSVSKSEFYFYLDNIRLIKHQH
ncbi:MAG TPA: discoidin domain-containing protein [Defluviitoga sp.]|jgi:hypothetical protein|nr:discoidin domain-containing protein [Defluviitoga sp.]HOP25475.1 discoidin domain-containing protein [Defluviitoga sp.]HPZ74966.1 discoidin domain-containing protein [Candidatus Pacearchaeota archaeon]HQD63491.1 discoidin domain-containing protein [Defluviitoga sp.]